MGLKRLSMLLGMFGVCALGLMAWFFGLTTGSAAGQTAKHSANAVMVITVTAGVPAELGFTLSRYSLLRSGPITFKVTNKGVVAHDFKICTSAVTSSAKNACAGKATKMLASGESVTLTVKLTKHGKYEFLCTVPGHAGAGMKGLLGIGVKVAPPAPANVSAQVSTSSSSHRPSTSPPIGAAATCASPQNTTVSVSEFEFEFTLSQNPIPC